MIHYIYKITCTHPTKCNGFVYYGKHKNAHPYKNTYMGGGALLTFYQERLGIQHFTKEVVEIFDNSDECEQREYSLVDVDFIKRTDTFNMSIGGRCSRNTRKAHPIKHRLLQYKKDYDQCKVIGVKVLTFRIWQQKEINKLYSGLKLIDR